MELPHKFKEQAQKKGGSDYTAPPYRIRGSDLDENFNRVKPNTKRGEGNNNAYLIDEDEQDGWKLVFPWWPPPTDGTWVLGSINGEMQWIATEDCEEEEEE